MDFQITTDLAAWVLVVFLAFIVGAYVGSEVTWRFVEKVVRGSRDG